MKLLVSIRCFAVVTAATIILGGWGATAAVAHGPCGCLDPVLTEPGGQIRIAGYPAYRVTFNPHPSDFGTSPPYLASAYRADAPTTTVLSRSRHRPTRNGGFRVPAGTPPGLYMVLIWDGDEAGQHNTHDYLHVAARDEPGEPDGRGVVAEGEEGPDPTEGDTRTPERTNGPATAIPRTPESTSQSEASGSQPWTRWPVLAGIALLGLGIGIAGGTAAARRRT